MKPRAKHGATPGVDRFLPDLLERAREEEGFGLRELARASGVSPGQLSRILAGKTGRPSLETLVRLAGALDRDIDALLVLAESPQAFSGERLDAARGRLLEAIERLPAADRRALAGEERDLRRQIEEVSRLEGEMQRLEARLVECRAASADPELAAEGPGSSFRSAEAPDQGDALAEAEKLERELDRCRAERESLDEVFAGGVRAVAARLFAEVRGRESAAAAAPAAWHPQSRGPQRAPFTVRPLSELLGEPPAPAERREPQRPATDRELRHVLRVWEQLSPVRRRRVVDFVDDQHRLSLHEQLSLETPDKKEKEQR